MTNQEKMTELWRMGMIASGHSLEYICDSTGITVSLEEIEHHDMPYLKHLVEHRREVAKGSGSEMPDE